MKTSNYVKCIVEPTHDFTEGKVYELTGDGERIIDDVGARLSVIHEGWKTNCYFLNKIDNWKYCDKHGSLINK